MQALEMTSSDDAVHHVHPIFTCLPENVSDWPASYDAELFRAKKCSGHISYQTKMVQSWVLCRLPETMLPTTQINALLLSAFRSNLRDCLGPENRLN